MSDEELTELVCKRAAEYPPEHTKNWFDTLPPEELAKDTTSIVLDGRAKSVTKKWAMEHG